MILILFKGFYILHFSQILLSLLDDLLRLAGMILFFGCLKQTLLFWRRLCVVLYLFDVVSCCFGLK